MPLSTSPRLSPRAEISQGIWPQEDQKAVPSAELHIRTQGSPPSPSSQPYEETKYTNTASRALTPSENYQMQQRPMIFNSGGLQWSPQGPFTHNGFVQDAFSVPPLFAPQTACAEYPQHALNGLPFNVNHGIKYSLDYASSCPRSLENIDLTGRPSDMAASFPPAAYFHSPPQLHPTPSLPDTSTPELIQLNDDWDTHHATQIKHEDQHDYNSPYSDMSCASTPYSTANDDEPIDKEQPYAQLIYRALLDAPDRTMVLRDIYDWFRRYTDKATHSETKGWQNSIRHNLSMNGAFEKVDSPSDAVTKGFMWRLTPAALREGVKSTTRYRSKAPNKRSHRTQPQPQRQASGAKGGHAARRAANLRRSQRAREGAMYHRPTPSSDPYSNGGFGSEWEYGSAYEPSPAYASRVDTPYTQMSLPYETHRDNASVSPMLGMTSHLVSPPRSYASTPIMPHSPINQGFMDGNAAYTLDQAPDELLFGASPTSSADEPITPVDDRHAWEQDITMGLDVYNDLSHFGGAV